MALTLAEVDSVIEELKDENIAELAETELDWANNNGGHDFLPLAARAIAKLIWLGSGVLVLT